MGHSWSTGLPSSFSHEPDALSIPVSHHQGQIFPEHLMCEAYSSHPEYKELEDSVAVPSTYIHVEDWELHSLRQSKLPCVGHYCSVSTFLPHLPFKSSPLFIYPSSPPVCLSPLYLYLLKSSCSLPGF